MNPTMNAIFLRAYTSHPQKCGKGGRLVYSLPDQGVEGTARRFMEVR